MYDSIHPTLIHKPVKIWTVTTNSKREIIVSLFEGATNIVKYDAELKRVNLVKKSGLVHPCRIACDDEDDIYCGDGKSNKIVTCYGNGDNLLQIHEVELERNSPGWLDLVITDQKLFMAEFVFLVSSKFATSNYNIYQPSYTGTWIYWTSQSTSIRISICLT